MLQVIIFSLIGGLLSLSVGLALIKNKKAVNHMATYATPFAAGVLLAVAFADLLPEAIHAGGDPADVLLFALLGLLMFFVLERFLRVFHHHHAEDSKQKTTNSLVITGDLLHNALDGIAIGAAFLIDPTTGIVATIAVAAHEIPQEIGDFGLLLKNGMKPSKVVIVNVLSALATTVTAVLTFGFGSSDASWLPFALAITAGLFIYIAASDIIPEIHDSIYKGKLDPRPLLLLAGVAVMLVVSPLAHEYIDAGHDHDEHSQHEDGHTDKEHADEHGHDHDDEDHEDEHTDEDHHAE